MLSGCGHSESFNAVVIPGGQSRDLSEYDSIAEWKKDLKKDMNEHNNKAEKEKDKYLKIAERNAKEYIKNKYGFEPIFIEKEAEYSISMVGGTDDAFVGWKYNYSGNVLLKFQKDEKKYNVLISGNEGDSEGHDDYQYSQIRQAVIDKCNTLTNSFAYNAEIQYGKSFGKSYDEEPIDNLINTYFDGNNLKEVLENASILMEYGNDIELKQLSIDFVDNESKVLILKYKSYNNFKQAQKDYDIELNDNYRKNHLHVIDAEILGFDMPEKALHIQEYLCVENLRHEIKTINVVECDGLYAVHFGRDIPIEISLSEVDSADNFKYLSYKYEQLSSGYSVKYDMSGIEKINDMKDYDLFLYFPIEKLKDISKYKNDDWTNRFEIGVQSKDREGNIKYEMASGGKSMIITHFNGKEYLMLEFGECERMKFDNEYRFVLLGYSVGDNI